MTYSIDIENLTVIAHHDDGSADDLNAEGEPCRTVDDLVAFITTLREQGFYGEDVEFALLDEIDDKLVEARIAKAVEMTPFKIDASAYYDALGAHPDARILADAVLTVDVDDDEVDVYGDAGHDTISVGRWRILDEGTNGGPLLTLAQLRELADD